MKIKDRQEFKNKPPAFTLRGDEFVAVAVDTMVKKNVAARRHRRRRHEGSRHRHRTRSGAQDRRRRPRPKTTPLSAIMTSDVKTARPDDKIIDWLRG